jgi:hypothetical protein
MAEQFLRPPVPSDHHSPVVEHRQGDEVQGERIVVAFAELRHPLLRRCTGDSGPAFPEER